MKKIFISFFLTYLRILAKIQLRKINPVVIGVGGASGKSSLVEVSELILSKKYKVKQSKGKNSETGIPLSILSIDIKSYDFMSWLKVAFLAVIRIISDWKKYDIFIIEMGIDSPNPPKNMSYLLDLTVPNISVLTNILIEHSQYFDYLVKSEDAADRKRELIEKISDQERLLLTSIDKSGRVIVNLDDENIKATTNIKAKTLTVSKFDKNADFYISIINIEENLFEIDFEFLKEKYIVSLNNPLPQYYAYTIIFAIALAFSTGIGVKDSIERLENDFILPPGRFSVFDGLKKSKILDSSYNSSLEACIGALELVNRIAGGSSRRVGVIGDMRELGTLSQIQHEMLAKEIVKNLDFAVIIGEYMNKYVKPIFDKEDFQFVSFDSFGKAKDFIKNIVKKDDIILVKASQNTLFLERAVEVLLLNKEDKKYLCRRGKYWDEIRRKTA